MTDRQRKTVIKPGSDKNQLKKKGFDDSYVWQKYLI